MTVLNTISNRTLSI